MEILNKPIPKLHLFMCLNDRSQIEGNLKPSCSPKLTVENYLEIKNHIKENNLSKEVYLTRTSCLGACSNNGGIILIYPKGEYFIVKNSKEIIELITTKLKNT